jgi:hypothetical protein
MVPRARPSVMSFGPRSQPMRTTVVSARAIAGSAKAAAAI